MSQAVSIAAATVVGLAMVGVMVDVRADAPSAPYAPAPCSTELAPVGSPPAPPTGLRIAGGIDFLEDLAVFSGGPLLEDLEVFSGPNAGPEPESFDAQLAGSGSHAYFDQLSLQPECLVAYSLRTQAQITQFKHPGEVQVNYDPVLDAAKWSWGAGQMSATQLRLPIHLDRPASGTKKLLIISDHMWDASMATGYQDGGWKWLQVTSRSGPGSTQNRIWFEPQVRAIGDPDKRYNETPPVFSLFSAREYLNPVPPTTNDGASACGINFGGDTLAPILHCFKAYANRWTRVWIELKVTAGQNYTEISWWMADELQEPKAILLNARQISHPPHSEFWYEYDTSQETRKDGGPMAAWGRNVVVLKDLADPSSVLIKPTK